MDHPILPKGKLQAGTNGRNAPLERATSAARSGNSNFRPEQS